MTAKIINADGHRIVVTEGDFRVQNRLYRMNRLQKYGLFTHKPERTRGIVVLLFGISLMTFSYNSWVFWVAVPLAISGLVLLVIAKKKYAVRISTVLGDQDVLVSDKKDNISRVVDALDEVKTNSVRSEMEDAG